MGKVQILLVEDSPGDERLLLEGFKIKAYPCDFMVIRDGQEALNYLVENKEEATKLPSLVISDIGLPRLNGMELMKAIKNDGVLSGIPFILLSGASETNVFWHKDDVAPDLFLEKPFGLDEVEATVTKIWEFLHSTTNLQTEGEAIAELNT